MGPDAAAPDSLLDRLFARVDVASLVVFRVAFGALMCFEMLYYLGAGFVRTHWVEPGFRFSFTGFGWVPGPGPHMYAVFVVTGIFAAAIALGLFYRVAAAGFFVGFTWIFLADKTHYLNHFYLISLLGLLLCFVPAHRAGSLDARLRPQIHSNTAPAWALWLLRFQIGVPYFFGGIAKINGDWLRGEPMRTWLAARSELFASEPIVYGASYGGLLFDLFAVPLLLWRRTRVPTFLVALAFHVANSQLWTIGVFPWLMIGGTALFLDPAWPRFSNRLWRPHVSGQKAPPLPGALARKVIVAALGLWVAVQVALPFRHHLYAGDFHWTENAFRFSWTMKLRTKIAWGMIWATDPGSGKRHAVDLTKFLTARQAKRMARHPDMIIEFCHHVRDEIRAKTGADWQVRAEIQAVLNTRHPTTFVDPDVDLAAEPRLMLGSYPWVVPLSAPLPPPGEGWKPKREDFLGEAPD